MLEDAPVRTVQFEGRAVPIELKFSEYDVFEELLPITMELLTVAPLPPRTEPLLMLTALLPRALLELRFSVPPLTVVAPLKPVLLPLRVVVPEAAVMAPEPERAAETVPPLRA